MSIVIRAVREDDADAFWKMMSALDLETAFMMYEPGERTRDMGKVYSLIGKAVTGEDLLIVAEADGEIIGYLSAQRGMPRRIRHSAYIVTGIRQRYQDQGIGSRFFQQLDYWAEQQGVTRLELTVMCGNEHGKHLYEKNGFVVEGVKRNAMIVDDA